MINDWYQAILDPNAPAEQTKELAINVASVLAAEKIITLHNPNQTLTHISGKFAPGPKFSFASGAELNQPNQFGSNIGGMDIHTGPWVNDYGLIGLDSAHCPVCKKTFDIDSFDEFTQLKESFTIASTNFLSKKSQPRISCPSCKSSSHITRWQTQPHLGFCNLSFIFWNWPPFENWKINIPDLVSRTLSHNIIVTYGRL